jgi:hypothetical protein
LSPGLPVIGLGALFCVLSALAAPIIEVGRIAQGHSSVASWLRVGRQFALAVAMIAALAVTLHFVYALVAWIGSPELSPSGALAMPSVLLGMSVGLLAALLAAAKGLQLAVRIRSVHLPPPAVRARVLPRRLLLQGAGILAAAWFPLLGFGLSPLSDGVVSRGPVPAVERPAVADVAGVVSPRKRVFDVPGHEPAPEAGAVPMVDGDDGSSAAPSSSGEEFVVQAPEHEAASEGDTGGSGGVTSTGGLAVSRDTAVNSQVLGTGGVVAPSR